MLRCAGPPPQTSCSKSCDVLLHGTADLTFDPRAINTENTHSLAIRREPPAVFTYRQGDESAADSAVRATTGRVLVYHFPRDARILDMARPDGDRSDVGEYLAVAGPSVTEAYRRLRSSPATAEYGEDEPWHLLAKALLIGGYHAVNITRTQLAVIDVAALTFIDEYPYPR